MEFKIDFPTVRKVTTEELGHARNEIAALGVVGAYRQSLARQDTRLARAPDADKLACRAGCSWCCYFSVDVRPVEAFNIVGYMERELSADDRKRIRREIEFNSSLLEKLSDNERVQRNVKCPFLLAGRCSIYSARPQTCRNYHATDATGCQKSFEEPENLDIDPDFAPLTYQIGTAHVDAFSEAMSEAGYDVAAYELNSALQAVIANETESRRRFEAKLKPFAGLQGNEAPAEFLDVISDQH
jgi:Fe-S-cluster containining protein